MKRLLIAIWTDRVGNEWTIGQWLAFIMLIMWFDYSVPKAWPHAVGSWSVIPNAIAALGVINVADRFWNRWRWLIWSRTCTINTIRAVAFDAKSRRKTCYFSTYSSNLHELKAEAIAFSDTHPDQRRLIRWVHRDDQAKTTQRITLSLPPHSTSGIR